MRATFLLFLCSLLITVNLEAQKLIETFQPAVKGLPIVWSTIVQDDGKILIGGRISYANDEPVADLIRINPDGTIDKSFTLNMQREDLIMRITQDETDNMLLYMHKDDRVISLSQDGSIDEQFSLVTEGLLIFGVWASGQKFLVSAYEYGEGEIFYRVNADGSIDTSFKKSYINGTGIRDFVELNDGRIAIIGKFTEYGGASFNRIVMLTPDGEIDPNFDPGGGIQSDYYVADIEVQNDKLVIAGDITSYDGVDFPVGIVRLNLDGSIDESFTLGTVSGLYQKYPEYIAIDNDQKILIAGTDFDGNVHNYYVHRLNVDGSIDNSFSTIELREQGHDSFDIHIVEDDNILITGAFENANNKLYCGLAKFDPSGSLMEDFNLKLRDQARITEAVVATDGKVLVCGDFIEINTTICSRIARLNIEGTVDNTFSPDFDLKNHDAVESIALQGDGSILIGGYFKGILNYNDLLLKLDPNGILDGSFKAAIPAKYVGTGIKDVRILDNEKILVGGTFETVNGEPRNKVALLHSDGALDLEFNKDDVIKGDFRVLGIDIFKDNGDIVIFGEGYSDNNKWVGKSRLLDSLGNVVPEFDAFDSKNIYALKILDESNIMYGGKSRYMYKSDRFRNAIDSLSISRTDEETFLGFYDIHLIDSTNVLIGGAYEELNGFDNSGITKLDLNGDVDVHFQFDVNGSVRKILKYDEEHLMIFGEFSSINGTPYNSAAMIRMDNFVPEVPDQLTIEVEEDSVMNFTAENLSITDEDDASTELQVLYLPGDNYEVVENKIVPKQEFSGQLTINAKITDEKDTVDFIFIVNVLSVNDPPRIMSLKNELQILNDNSLTLSLDNFEVSDVDNSLDDISLIGVDGDDYFFEGLTIHIPEKYLGDLPVTIKVTDGMDESIPYQFTVYVATITALSDINSDQIKVGPNPAINGDVEIFNDTEDRTIQGIHLLDMSGRIIKRFSNMVIEPGYKSTIKLDVSTKGTYLLNLISDRGTLSKKLIVK